MDTIFYTIPEFKELVGAKSITIRKGEDSGKLSCITDNDKRFKVQGDLNTDAELRFLLDSEDINDACLVNIVEQEYEDVATL